MDTADKLRYIEEVRAAVRKLDKWADEKIENGGPLSPVEKETIENALKQIRELRIILNGLRE